MRTHIIKHTITINEIKQGYKKWIEETSTLPSGRYLGHVKVILTPGGNSYDNEHINYADNLWNICTTIANCVIVIVQPLIRWLKNTLFMIEKSKGNNKISRKRVINLYEDRRNKLPITLTVH